MLVLVEVPSPRCDNRRLAWQQHFEGNDLDPAAVVRVEIAGNQKLREMLDGDSARAVG